MVVLVVQVVLVLEQLAVPEVQALSSLRFQILGLLHSQAVLHPRYRLRYRALRFTP
jgi:hypothetical protein